jgi:hypothetical protein
MIEPFSLLAQNLPSWLQREIVRIPPRGTLDYESVTWRGALAVLEHGSVMLSTAGGAYLDLDQGAVVCLDRIRVATIRNTGSEPAVIVVVRRAAVGYPVAARTNG